MTRLACPICGDPSTYALWIDSEPPGGCPYDDAWQRGEPRTIATVSDCAYQMGKARQRAEWLKRFPQAFDARGRLTYEGRAMIAAACPGEEVVL